MKKIARLRKLRGWTQIDLAHEVGVNQSSISRAEKGDGGVSLEVYRAIAECLDVPLHELFSPDDSSAIEARLLEVFRSVPPELQERWLGVIDEMLSVHHTQDR